MRRVGEVVEETYMAGGGGGVEVVREEVERAACACRLGKMSDKLGYTRSRKKRAERVIPCGTKTQTLASCWFQDQEAMIRRHAA